MPAGTISAWQDLLDYARAHPRDPRAPEALYWLVRISRWCHVDDRGGYRAFRLLHTRYPGSSWTRRSPTIMTDRRGAEFPVLGIFGDLRPGL